MTKRAPVGQRPPSPSVRAPASPGLLHHKDSRGTTLTDNISSKWNGDASLGPHAPIVQPKLTISQPHDIHERETDRVAAEIMTMPLPTSYRRSNADIQKSALTRSTESRARPAPLRPDSRFAFDFARVPVHPTRPTEHGSPLPNSVRSLVARTTGHLPDHSVRVHTDAASRASADRQGARAFTFGRDIHLGPAGSPTDTRLLFHEAIHTLQQRPATQPPTTTGQDVSALERQASRATAAALIGGATRVARDAVPATIHRDAVSDIRGKLSYGTFDWAITDSEAMEALAMLGEIPAPVLRATLAALGSRYVTRLLDNLPDAAKTDERYQRIIQVVGVSDSTEYVGDLLSYGVFDWAVTDAEVTRVYNLFANLAATEQEKMLTSLETAGRLGRLVDNSDDGHHRQYLRPWMNTLTKGALTYPQKAIFHRIVDESKSGPIETLTLASEKRFNVTVRASGSHNSGVDWKPSSLSQTYLALELLPDAHTKGNKFLKQLGQFDEPVDQEGLLLKGFFAPGKKELAINVQDTDVQDTAIHETGHAVDAMLGWTRGAEPSKPARGGWKEYHVARYQNCATDMVADSANGIQNDLTAPQRSGVIKVMTKAMQNHVPEIEEGMKTAIRALAWFGTLDEAKRRAVLSDPALKALEVGVNLPWFHAANGGVHLGAHVYQQSYPNWWVRYRHEARARMVDPYQFRGPGEWFAVAYAKYYTPDNRGKGAKLNDKDPDTKLWFDAHVDKAAPTR
jgi:hypothetical protein